MAKYIVIERPNGLVTIVRSEIETASEEPLTEHEQIINELFDKVKKLNEPAVSVNEAFGFRRGVAGCPLCNGRGEYHTGGSFGGSVEVHQCECTKGQTEH